MRLILGFYNQIIQIFFLEDLWLKFINMWKNNYSYERTFG
ncbi:hypothetical protein MJ1HA_0271 [Metallosphaera sedula]|nr:hypothetical protein MJ1HA_0271 [Metallosphaera sedula]